MVFLRAVETPRRRGRGNDGGVKGRILLIGTRES